MDILQISLLILMIFGMVLIVLFIVLRARQQKDEAMSEAEFAKKEEKLMLLYFEVEDMINGLKEYVQNSKEVLSLEFDRAQAQAEGVRALQRLPVQQAVQEPAPPAEPDILADDEEEPSKRQLYETARQMLMQNVDPSRIAEELHLSRSEITFIQKLAL